MRSLRAMIRNKMWQPAACTRCHASLKPQRIGLSARGLVSLMWLVRVNPWLFEPQENGLSERSSASLICTSIILWCFGLNSACEWVPFVPYRIVDISAQLLASDWKQQLWKFWLMVNFHLSYYSLPRTSPSSEMRNSRAVKWKHDDFKSALADWVCIYLSSIFTARDALRYKEKSSLIYIVNCLNRGTDLNRLLISYRKLLRCRIKIRELY